MKIEEFLQFFLDNPEAWGRMGTPSVDIMLVRPTNRGYRAIAGGCGAWGDTVEDAVQAVFDHVMHRPSKHSAWQQPYFQDSIERTRIGYDYRTTDWEFGMERER